MNVVLYRGEPHLAIELGTLETVTPENGRGFEKTSSALEKK
jgi:hypothetical protein